MTMSNVLDCLVIGGAPRALQRRSTLDDFGDMYWWSIRGGAEPNGLRRATIYQAFLKA